MRFWLGIQILLLLGLFFSSCEQRYLYRSKVRVPSSKYSDKKELLVPNKPKVISKPNFQEFKFKRRLLNGNDSLLTQERKWELAKPKVKLKWNETKFVNSDTTAIDKAYRKRVLLGMSGAALLLGGLLIATPLGFVLALLGFALLIIMLYQKDKQSNLNSGIINESNELEKSVINQSENRLETKPKGERARFGLTIVLFVITLLGILALLSLLFIPIIEMIIIGLIFLTVSPSLALVASLNMKYTEDYKHFGFYETASIISIIGIVGFLLSMIALGYGAILVFIILALILMLILWASVRSTLKKKIK